MAKYRPKAVVDAVRVTDATFDAPNPNPEHLPGVVYDPVARSVFIPTVDGGQRAGLGDWLIHNAAGQVRPMSDDAFRMLYEPVDAHAEDAPPVSI